MIGTELISLTENEQSLFVSINEAVKYCSKLLSDKLDDKSFEFLTAFHILPVFTFESELFFLKKDLEDVLPALAALPLLQADYSFGGSLFSESIPLSSNTKIDTTIRETKLAPAFYSATRNLLKMANLEESQKHGEVQSLSYFPPTRVLTSSPYVQRGVQRQLEKAKIAEPRANDFARSAHYMGSKRSLVGFLVEAISSVLPENGIVIDLMCGSGSASGAFNNFWRTIASDAQSFCPILAKIHGAGFSTQKAALLLERLIPAARIHADSLLSVLDEAVAHEEKIFHGDVSQSLLCEYQSFINAFPTFPSRDEYLDWKPSLEVDKRKLNNKLYPYCLFTTYFANIYFGLRQSIEIDSLRYAIDQLENDLDRSWALGALITTLSAVGTTHAAHFAQPKYKNAEDLTLINLMKVIEQRTYSVFHEFSIRLMNLAEESQTKANSIETISGPWLAALENVENLIKFEQQNVVVYLDAPYKRDEYSRYYHVLETLCVYSYPSATGKGKLPDKKTQERFSSEFFTRVQYRNNQAFVKIICEILKRNWVCAWSYSNNADASILPIIDEVNKLFPCQATSYSTPHEHKSQGKGVSKKKVVEYLILFERE